MLDSLLRALVEHPQEEDRWLVLADWVEENDDPRRAQLLRLNRKLVATCTSPDSHPERRHWQSEVVAMLRAGVQPIVPRRTIALAPEVTITFAWCPPGSFLMGSPEDESRRDDDETHHRVTLTRGFWLGIHAVTQAQWQAVEGSNPSRFKGDTLPVETVSWLECQAFIAQCFHKQRLKCRLPTEAEWEYACRAGTTTPFYWGQTLNTDLANYSSGSRITKVKTTPVGSFPPNAWGLCDMHGNVWELCEDRYHANPAGDRTDPVQAVGHRYVMRGGSWDAGPSRYCMSSHRGRNAPDFASDCNGFRIVLIE